MTLFEAYKNRLAISESVYAKSHDGEKMDNNRKLVTAKCLENFSFSSPCKYQPLSKIALNRASISSRNRLFTFDKSKNGIISSFLLFLKIFTHY